MAHLTRLRQRWRSLDRRTFDVAAALAMFALMVVELAAKGIEPGESVTKVLAYVLAAGMTLPFAAHRDYPMIAVAVICVALVAYSAGQFSAYPGYAMFVLLFGIGLHAGRPRPLIAFGAVAAAMAVSLSLQPAHVVNASTWISTFLALTVAWLLGENLRARRLRWMALQLRARSLEVQREERARQAVSEERLRIARELHDVVAHSMSVIAVQAGVANHVIGKRPELAQEALATIETASRAALVEMRRLLGVLRQGDEPSASLTPAPGLTDIRRLVTQFIDAGLAVDMRMDPYDDGGIPDGVDLSAYRIVQEGLTNVLRHGGPEARVDIGFPGMAVHIEICDDGRHPFAWPPIEPGHGLIGMRERAAVFGGELSAGPRPEGGFRLAATLPFGDGTHIVTASQRTAADSPLAPTDPFAPAASRAVHGPRDEPRDSAR